MLNSIDWARLLSHIQESFFVLPPQPAVRPWDRAKFREIRVQIPESIKYLPSSKQCIFDLDADADEWGRRAIDLHHDVAWFERWIRGVEEKPADAWKGWRVRGVAPVVMLEWVGQQEERESERE